MSLHLENLDEDQHEAVDLCLDVKKKLVGVTGEAGSGKTSILKFVYDQLSEEYPADLISLVAPTGRAAKRIQEATGIPAKTIHRFMRYSMPADDEEYGLPSYDKFHKYPSKFVLCDEASMVNDELYRGLIDALPAGGAIRFFGDANQLPPVEGVSPFLNILERFPSVRLRKNYRSDDGIVTSARQIIDGRVPQKNDKFQILNPGIGNMFEATDRFIDDTFRGMNSQLIIPTKVGKYGTHAFNRYLQQKLNGQGKTLHILWQNKKGEDEERRFRVGDKVIWTKNDYRLNLFNGMIGWISGIDHETGDITLQIDDLEKAIPTHIESYDQSGRTIFQYDPRRNLDLAYAITTHKSQGSEFDKIVIVLNRSYVLDRANFYTAVTRAKKHATVICGAGALAAAMKKRSGF